MGKHPESIVAELNIAPMRSRVLAALIDATAGITFLGTALAGFAAYRARRSSTRAAVEGLGSRRGKAVLVGGASALSVLFAVRQSPGQRLAGIRFGDVRTGGALSIPHALLYIAIGQGKRALLKVVTRPLIGRGRERTERSRQKTAPHIQELGALMREHTEDPQGREKELEAYYREHQIEPRAFPAVLMPAIVAFAWDLATAAPILFSPLRQSLEQRLARVVVLRAPRA